MRYTYLGPSGTFTESALLSVPGASDAERLPRHQRARRARTPERGRGGRRHGAHRKLRGGRRERHPDAIAASEGVRIIREVLVPIRFVLVTAKPISIEDVKTISTHSHAWAQVRGWAQENVPTAAYLPGSSTAAAAVDLLEEAAPMMRQSAPRHC